MGVTIDRGGAEIHALRELADLTDADVLEVGCGDGRMTRRYANEAAHVLALDTDEERIARAVDATPAALRVKVDYVVGDITEAQLVPEAYDVAILAHSL
jgi:2-polyprenyl-3-methyl-5-hydroxy-6-metoxy-1,4-benzoquinol methylase